MDAVPYIVTERFFFKTYVSFPQGDLEIWDIPELPITLIDNDGRCHNSFTGEGVY